VVLTSSHGFLPVIEYPDQGSAALGGVQLVVAGVMRLEAACGWLICMCILAIFLEWLLGGGEGFSKDAVVRQ
jgi:hypothetical protein